MERIIKDLKVVAHPDQDFASLEGVTPEGLTFLVRQYGRVQHLAVRSEDVNDLFENLRTRELTYSFKLAQECA